jgi:hypothetical protein
VQRPSVLETVSLDLYLIREVGLQLRRVPALVERTDLVSLVDEFAGRFYDELDYRLECENGIRIAEHMKSLPKVVIPKCYPKYTSRRVHTAEWIDGEKLAQSKADDVLDLVNVGVVAYLTQLLGEGFFHADPHPGNMIRTPDGRLCILDFGLMTELTDDQKYGMIEAVVHLIQRDYTEIGDDFKKLDFIPKDVDVRPIVPALTNVFNAALAGGGAKSINFNELAADLAEITFKYPFRIPPYFALVIRAIGVLEGIALVGNPEFAIVDEAFPYISQRLLTDKSPRLRAALRYAVYGRDGVFDAERLIDMLGAFDKFDVVSQRAGGVTYGHRDPQDGIDADAARMSTAMGLFFSPEGKFFRDFLLDEAVRGVDVLSRNALMRLPELLPGPWGLALQSARFFAPAPLLALVPEFSPQDEKALRSTQALLDFFLGQDTPFGQSARGDDSMRVNKAAQTMQRLRPVVRQYSEALRDFGVQGVGRLAELYTRRALGYTLTVLLPDSQRRNFQRDFPSPPPPGLAAASGGAGAAESATPEAAAKGLPSVVKRMELNDQSVGGGKQEQMKVNWQERDIAQQVIKSSETVKADINKILRIEPNWRMYSEDMQLLEPAGATLGLAKVKQLLGVVRRFIGAFIETEVVNIKTGLSDSLNPVMYANGTIQLSGRNLPIPGMTRFNLLVAGSCNIFFDEQGKVSEVDVDSWSFNGRPIRLPKLDNINSNNLSPQDTLKLLGWTREALFGG